MNIETVKSIKPKTIMTDVAPTFIGYIGTLKMQVRKVEERIGKFKNTEIVLAGLAKFAHINGTEYRAKVVFFPKHCVENIAEGEVIELPIHRVTSANSKTGYTFVVEENLTESDWDF